MKASLYLRLHQGIYLLIPNIDIPNTIFIIIYLLNVLTDYINNCRSVFPTIIPARYRLSGRVERENLPAGAELKVRFTSSSSKADSAAAGGKVMVSEKGTFSIYLPAGKYAVSVELGSDQKGKPKLTYIFIINGDGINFYLLYIMVWE